MPPLGQQAHDPVAAIRQVLDEFDDPGPHGEHRLARITDVVKRAPARELQVLDGHVNAFEVGFPEVGEQREVPNAALFAFRLTSPSRPNRVFSQDRLPQAVVNRQKYDSFGRHH